MGKSMSVRLVDKITETSPLRITRQSGLAIAMIILGRPKALVLSSRVEGEGVSTLRVGLNYRRTLATAIPTVEEERDPSYDDDKTEDTAHYWPNRN